MSTSQQYTSLQEQTLVYAPETTRDNAALQSLSTTLLSSDLNIMTVTDNVMAVSDNVRTVTDNVMTVTDNINPTEEEPGMKSVCYYYYDGYKEIHRVVTVVDYMNMGLCTHIVYQYAHISLPYGRFDEEIDNRIGRSTGVVSMFKQKNMKVLLELREGRITVENPFRIVLSSASTRQDFIDYIIVYLKNHGFDGLQLDWFSPLCWERCNRYGVHDLAQLLKEMKIAFSRERLLLSAAIPDVKEEYTVDDDTLSAFSQLDWFYTLIENQRYGIAELKHINASTNLWISKGILRHKMLVHLKTLFNTYEVLNVSEARVLPSFKRSSLTGPITGYKTHLSFAELCPQLLGGQFTRNYNDDTGTTPSAFSSNQWVAYDDAYTMIDKAEYVKEMGLGGVVFESIEHDDFEGNCHCGRFPLLRAVNTQLGRLPGSLNDCEKPKDISVLKRTVSSLEVSWRNPFIATVKPKYYEVEITINGTRTSKQQPFEATKYNYTEQFYSLQEGTTYNVSVTILTDVGNLSESITAMTLFRMPFFRKRPAFNGRMIRVPGIETTKDVLPLLQCQLAIAHFENYTISNCEDLQERINIESDVFMSKISCHTSEEAISEKNLSQMIPQLLPGYTYVFGVVMKYDYEDEKKSTFLCSDDVLVIGSEEVAAETAEDTHIQHSDLIFVWIFLGVVASLILFGLVSLVIWKSYIQRNRNYRDNLEVSLQSLI